MGSYLKKPEMKHKGQVLFSKNGPLNDPRGYRTRRDRKKDKIAKLAYVKVTVFIVMIPVVLLLVSGSFPAPAGFIKNETARDPTWDELMAFLREDDTDRQQYQEEVFDCTHFAQRLHNNAEQAGIRAAYVTVFWYNNSTGHALNAFETTDKGLTFVDCTGSGNILTERQSMDKIAYVEKGKKYGTISIYHATSPEYDYYLQYIQNKDSLYSSEDPNIVKEVNIYWCDYSLGDTIAYRLHQRI
ncbi:MAG: hypothetical protein H5T43_02215 [Methanomethylovorans sp.]|jgi:hypothetical protein|nr:hypothetical protein [Methanomethylovorans sp.]